MLLPSFTAETVIDMRGSLPSLELLLKRKRRRKDNFILMSVSLSVTIAGLVLKQNDYLRKLIYFTSHVNSIFFYFTKRVPQTTVSRAYLGRWYYKSLVCFRTYHRRRPCRFDFDPGSDFLSSLVFLIHSWNFGTICPVRFYHLKIRRERDKEALKEFD